MPVISRHVASGQGNSFAEIPGKTFVALLHFGGATAASLQRVTSLHAAVPITPPMHRAFAQFPSHTPEPSGPRHP